MSIFIVAHITELRNHLWGHLHTKHRWADRLGPGQPPYGAYANYTTREEWEEWHRRFTSTQNQLIRCPDTSEFYRMRQRDESDHSDERRCIHVEKRRICVNSLQESLMFSPQQRVQLDRAGCNLHCRQTFQLKRYCCSCEAFRKRFQFKLAKWASVSSETSVKLSRTGAEIYRIYTFVSGAWVSAFSFLWN